MKILKNNYLRWCLIGVSFLLIDFLLRFFTRWLGYYSIFELIPSIFSMCWVMIIIIMISALPKTLRKIVFCGMFGFYAFYAIAQYVYYLIFNKFFYISDIRNASEGMRYIDYVLENLDGSFWGMLVVLMLLLIGCLIFFPEPEYEKQKYKKSYLFKVTLIATSCIIMNLLPAMYTSNDQFLFLSEEYEYEQFSNPGFDMELVGLYHYIGRDIWKHHLKKGLDRQLQYEKVDDYLKSKNIQQRENEMTNIFEGKNLILIQMESIDDWIVNEENMPTVKRLIDEGISFPNMHTCLYGSGGTFSTEFAFNTGIYQSTTGTAAYSMTQNAFPYSIANLLKEKGYLCRSYHQNTGDFYSRSNIHPTLGYEKYVSTSSIVSEKHMKNSDESMIEDDTVWEMMTEQKPFFDFIITYGAHVPYSYDDELVQWALEKYPKYDVKERDSELNAIYAKARTLDDMFAALLIRLEEEDLLDDTVIIAYADHYCYGLNNKNTMLKLSEENGSTILERTPAFIWYKGCESREIAKICQTIDWAPTIANFYGVDIVPYVLGNDIFDDSYAGCAIFPDGTWLTEEAYVVNGIVKWNYGMSDGDIKKMNEHVQQFYEANEAILFSDYYRYKAE